MRRIVNTALSFLLPLMMAASCTSAIEEEVEKLRNKVSEIEAAFTDLNNQIADINKLIAKVQSGDHIESIQEVTAGCYVLTFESKDVLVLKDGDDGKTPVIGIRYDSLSGYYCWTVQQGSSAPVWLTDSYGRRITAEATVPKLRISDGYWQVSYDDGAHWTNLFQSSGSEGTSVFSNIDWSDPYVVVFTLTNGTKFFIPTMEAVHELDAVCDSINNNIEAYRTMVTSVNSAVYVKSVSEIYENGKHAGYSISLENGYVLVIKDGVELTESVFLDIAEDPADGRMYWRVKYGTQGEFTWLLRDGERVCATIFDGQPEVGFKDSLGVHYFTVSYDGFRTWDWVRDNDGMPIAAAGSVTFNLFTSAEISDTSVTLTSIDGTTMTFMRASRERVFSLDIMGSFDVYADSSYTFSVRVVDTLTALARFQTFGEYNAQAGISVRAVGVDACTVLKVAVDSAMFKCDSLSHNRVTHMNTYRYQSTYDITMKMGAELDTNEVSRVAVFLNWDDRSVMRVAKFRNRALEPPTPPDPPVDTTGTVPPIDTTGTVPPIDTTGTTPPVPPGDSLTVTPLPVP
ncbi:MAG: hypothetical protein J5699_04255 [Bacteroidales bacterium]|nr:hypothetical protein [Bacteroidales bacterium]